MRRAVLAAALVLGGCGGAERTAGTAAPGAAGTRGGGDPDVHLEALQRIADRSGGTRSAGTAGDRRTVEYIGRTLRRAGWRVREQPVRFPFYEERSPPRLGALRPGREVRAAEYSGAGRVRARVHRLPGRGCSVADFAGLPRGDVALVDRGTCLFRVKARNAARAEAAAVVISDVHGRTPVATTLLRPGIRIPVLIVTAPAARRIEDRMPLLRVDSVSEERTTTNVIAESDPDRGRWTMAGAHHDSVSAGPGLNDNGTGVASLLAVAERLRGRRGLRFGFWAGEELALHGSRRYVRSLDATERRAVRAYVNLDMVGSPNGVARVYDRDDAVERVLRRAIGRRVGEVALSGASDHAPFERAGIPVGGIFTGASARGRGPGPADPCYHRSCDDLENVDRRLLRRMTDAAERALRTLAFGRGRR